jgi:transposase
MLWPIISRSSNNWRKTSCGIRTRLEHIYDKRLRRVVRADIKRLEKRSAEERQRLLAALRQHDDLAARFDLVESIPSIGERTALCSVIRMPELGWVSREEIAALAGLATFVRQSGQHEGQAHIGGGRAKGAPGFVYRRLARSVPLEPRIKSPL